MNIIISPFSQLKIYSLVPSQPHPVLAVSMLGPEYTHSPVKWLLFKCPPSARCYVLFMWVSVPVSGAWMTNPGVWVIITGLDDWTHEKVRNKLIIHRKQNWAYVHKTSSIVSYPDLPPKRKGGSGEYSTASHHGLAVRYYGCHWTGLLEWTTGMDYTGLTFLHKKSFWEYWSSMLLVGTIVKFASQYINEWWICKAATGLTASAI